MRKFFTQLIFTMAFLLISSNVFSFQTLTFAERQQTLELEEALQQIKEAKMINFIYDAELVKSIYVHQHQVNLSNNVDQIMASLFKGTNLSYKKLTKNTFVIKRKDKAINPPIVVKGKILSAEDRNPLPGVSVLVKSTNKGTVTDIEGNYILEVPSEDAVLIFSYIGYQTQEIQVRGRQIIDVTLEQDVQQLSEVVVTAVGIESDKSALGYSIQNVDVEDIYNAREPNLSTALAGKVAGVQVISSSGSPGASATVRIRGSRSFLGNEPLYVIDGLPIDNSTSANGTAGVDVSNRAIDINPNDIEKISILKGPAATVLYGSRGANGVVMITTKKGKQGKPVVTFNTAFGINEVNKLPERQSTYAQGRPVGGLFVYRGPETGEAASYGPLISDLEFDGDPTYPYDVNGRLVAAGTGNGMPARAYDVYDAFWVLGQTFDNNLSVVGGSEQVRYYVSIGNLYQTGIVPNANFERTSVKANVDAFLSEKLSLGISSNYIHSGGFRIQRGSNVSGVTTGVFRNTPTFDIGNEKTGQEAADDPDTYIFPDGTQRAYRGNALYDNPFWVVNRTPYEDDVNRFIGSINLNYQIKPWLKFNYKLGLDRFTDVRDFAWDINSSSEVAGEVNQFIRTSNRINSDFLALINYDFSDKFNVNATLGHNYFRDENLTESSEGQVLSVQGFYDISNAQVIQSSRFIGREAFYGVFADVKLSYNNYLYLNLSARNDWASTLPAEDNSFFYPAASVGFEFTEFFKMYDNDILPYGKLRASYGQVGNSPPIYRTVTYFEPAVIDGDGLLEGNSFPAFGLNGFEREGLLGNNRLRPELTTTYEVGADLKLLKGIVGLDVTYYYSFTEDPILTTTLPAPSGYTSITLNAGEIENKGWELTLDATPVKNSSFSWEITTTFTRNRSLVVALPPGVESVSLAEFSAISSLNVVGQPYGVLSGTRYRRNDAGQLIIGSDGWPLFADTQGIIGDPNPDWFAGIRNSFNYKNLSLSFLWDIRKGGDLWNGTKAVMDYLGVSKESGDLRNVTGFVFEGVTEEGEVNTIPVDFANPAQGLAGIKWRRAGTLLGLAEDNIEDASWIRLRDVTLNYGLPSRWFSGSLISTIDVALYGRNLLLFTEYSGIDPETNLRGPSNAQGWDYFNLPNTKSYGISLKAVLK